MVDGLLGDGDDGASYMRGATLDERQQMVSRITFIYARFVKLYLGYYSSMAATEFMQGANERFRNAGV